ncbi:ABC transporter permease [Nanoarchaeota archaeon]
MGFFITLIGLILGDILTPLVSLLIYAASAGIPGWTLFEFILFQGTLILTIGVWRTFFLDMLWVVIFRIQEGEFDKVLLKPFPTLATVTTEGFDFEGVGEIIAGMMIVGFALYKLQIFTWLMFPYILIILLAVLFMYSLLVFTASLAFIFVKAWRLAELINVVEKFARWPITVYSTTIRFVLTFVVPAAIASYYPAAVLLGKEPLSRAAVAVIPVIGFFILSLLSWKWAISKYTSAGG